MVAYASAASNSTATQIPIETMRGLAIVLLVSYHVIGPDASAGLGAAYPDLPRLFADFFIDLRMPFFAFIAGFFYAIRPPSQAGFAEFCRGKLIRLFVPCILASILFAVAANILGNRFAVPWGDLWRVPFTSYAHFWFLQSLMVIFVCFGLFDALTRGRFSVVVLLASAAVYLLPVVAGTPVMSLNGALYLLPYFMLGVVMNRYGALIWSDGERLSLLLMCIAVACALWNIKVLHETGSFSFVRRDVQSLGFGLAICALTFLCAPRWPLLERLSPYGFTIYLYHVFGTVAARTACDALQVMAPEVRFALGLAGGLLLPILLHDAVSRIPWLNLLVLGRAQEAPRQSPPLRA